LQGRPISADAQAEKILGCLDHTWDTVVCVLMLSPYLKNLSPQELFKKLVSLESLRLQKKKIFRATDGNSKQLVKAEKGDFKLDKGVCFMAQSNDDEEEEVYDPKYLKLLSSKSRQEIAMLVKNLSTEVVNLNKVLTLKDEQISNLTEENAGWADKFKSLVANFKSVTKTECLICPHLREKVEYLKSEKAECEKLWVANETELKEKWKKEQEATKVDDAKKGYAFKFVPKTGLGYKADKPKKSMACLYEKKKKHKSHENTPYHDPKIEALYDAEPKTKKLIDADFRYH
jgi:hypothetical protein